MAIENSVTQNSGKSKKMILIIIGLILFNFITYNLFVKTGGYDAHGNYIPYSVEKNLKSSLVTLLFGLPILCLIFGLIISIFPHKNGKIVLSYKPKND
jgi:hypothetical protein